MKIHLQIFTIAIFLSLFSFTSTKTEAAPSLRIQNISPGTTISSGNSLTFTVVPTDLISPTFTTSDSFATSSIASTSVNSQGIFFWTPGHHEGGTHTITINATDAQGKSATTTQTITVKGLTSKIVGLSDNSTVIVGKFFTFPIQVSGFDSPIHTVRDSFLGSSVNNVNIGNDGVFRWTPTMTDIGSHTLVITTSDLMRSGATAVATTTVTVSGPTISIGTTTPGNSVGVNQTLSFLLTSEGFLNPKFSVSDSYSESSVRNANLDGQGRFSWSPGIFQLGDHTISINASDVFGRSATTSVTISVVPNSVYSLTLSTVSPNKNTGVGSRVTFQSNPIFFTPTAFTVSDSFAGSSVSSTSINGSGFFSWTPTSKDIGTHTITVTASDTSGKTASASNTIIVTAAPLIKTPTSSLGTSAPGNSGNVGSSFRFTQTLQIGSKGNEVMELQKKLSVLGFYSGATNGTFGPMTQQAVKKFQTKNGISAIGTVGPLTRQVLNSK